MALGPEGFVDPIPTKVPELKRLETQIDARLRTKQYHKEGHKAVIYSFVVHSKQQRKLRDLYVAKGWADVLFEAGDKNDGGWGASVTLVGK